MAVGYFTFDGNDALETADDTSFDITGDIELIALIRWNTTDLQESFMASWVVSGDNKRWIFEKSSGGTGQFIHWWSDTGSSNNSQSSTNHGLTTGTWYWVRVTMDADDGSGNREHNFYYSTDDPSTAVGSVSWTLISNHVVAGTTSIANVTAGIWIGGRNGGSFFFDGDVAAAWVYDGIGGTLVADPDFRDDSQGDWSSLPVTDGQGNSWDVATGDPVYTPSTDRPPSARRLYIPRRSLARRQGSIFPG